MKLKIDCSSGRVPSHHFQTGLSATDRKPEGSGFDVRGLPLPQRLDDLRAAGIRTGPEKAGRHPH